MNILNLLSNTSEIVNSIGVEPVQASLDGIGKAIGWIFDLFTGFTGAVAVGVILFTLILKTVVLPLDIFSRVKTKKQSLLMETMRPQMEKLQKQYANDKTMYNQKVMELQKANGYNPLGACLPMIVSLVIFMVILSAFSTYSNYAVLSDYGEMVEAYNSSVAVYVMEDETDEDTSHFLMVYGDGQKKEGKVAYIVDFDRFTAHYEPIYDEQHKEDTDEEGNPAPKTFDSLGFDTMNEDDKWEIVLDYVCINARAEAATWYRENNIGTKFGWIGNLWYPDSMLNKEVPDFSKFSSSIARANVAVNEIDFNEVTFDLSPEKDTYNGYFVLIVLSIGLMFLQQFIMAKSQKAANELSSVDGSAAKTNKWMMIIMPIIFGLFSFMYSAAFSIYMIVNTLYGLISTLIINKAVTVYVAKHGFKKKKNTGRPTNKAKRLK